MVWDSGGAFIFAKCTRWSYLVSEAPDVATIRKNWELFNCYFLCERMKALRMRCNHMSQNEAGDSALLASNPCSHYCDRVSFYDERDCRHDIQNFDRSCSTSFCKTGRPATSAEISATEMVIGPPSNMTFRKLFLKRYIFFPSLVGPLWLWWQ